MFMVEMKMIDDTPLRSERKRNGLIIYGIYDKYDILVCVFFSEDMARRYCEYYPFTYKKMKLYHDAIDALEVE